MKNHIKKYIINTALLLISLLVCFVIMDIILNILHPITKIYSYSPYSDYIMRQNQEIEFNSKEFRTKITTNSLSLRDDEFDLSKENRILLLGDSFIFGHGVNNSQTFAYILEKKLNDKLNNKFLVINAGHNGYDTKREAAYLKHYGYRFKPTMIIVGFVINDPYSNSGEYLFSPIPLGMARYIPLKSLASLIEYLKNPGRLLHKLGFSVKYKQVDFFDCLREKKCSKGWQDTFKYLDIIHDYADKNNSKLIILNIPVQEQIRYDNKREKYNVSLASHKLSEYCNKKGIIFIDLLGVLSKDHYYTLNGHLTSEGHQKTAEYIYSKLEGYFD